MNSGQAAIQLKEVYEELKILVFAHEKMEANQTVTAALAVAEERMRTAAYHYVMVHQGQQPVTQQPRTAHVAPGSGAEGRGFARTSAVPSRVPHNSGVPAHNSGVTLPIAPLNTPVQHTPIQQTPVARVSAAGRVPTAPGLPDAIIPSTAQMHPRTLARIRAAQGLPPETAPPGTTAQGYAQAVVAEAGGVALPGISPPSVQGDLPELPLIDVGPSPIPPHPGPPPGQR